MKYNYWVMWNRGDDTGRQPFVYLSEARKYAKSVHGNVYKEKIVTIKLRETRLIKVSERRK